MATETKVRVFLIRTIDAGSFPLDSDLERYKKGAVEIEMESSSKSEEALYFIEEHNKTFRRKAGAMGAQLAVVAYAQCRGMIDQFLEPVFRRLLDLDEVGNDSIISETTAQQVAVMIAQGDAHISASDAQMPEILALERDVKILCEDLDTDLLRYKACLTGPLELTLNFQRLLGFPRVYDSTLVEFFTDVVKAFLENSKRNTKHLRSEVFSLDEPSIGLEGLADFFSDTGTDSNLAHLQSCWNRIYDAVSSDSFRGLHLHTSPFEQLFNAKWNLLEAHVGVFVRSDWLERYDKFVRAAIMRTDGPDIPKGADLKAAWERIRTGDYEQYLEKPEDMMTTLRRCIERYGVERVPFAGPECGLGSWDWPHGDAMAIRNLENVNKNVVKLNSGS
ncbi:MAG: hypothetical protein ACFFB7_06365 [Candidatus Sifarchaeia archaeon]